MPAPRSRRPFLEHERRGEQHRARVGDALAGDVVRRAVARPEDARALVREPAPREHAARVVAPGELCERDEERVVARDHVERLGPGRERPDRLAGGQELELEPGVVDGLGDRRRPARTRR